MSDRREIYEIPEIHQERPSYSCPGYINVSSGSIASRLNTAIMSLQVPACSTLSMCKILQREIGDNNYLRKMLQHHRQTI